MITETRSSALPPPVAGGQDRPSSCAAAGVIVEALAANVPSAGGSGSVCVVPTDPTHQPLENRYAPHGARVPVEEGVISHGLVHHEDRNVSHDRSVAGQPFPAEVIAKRSRCSRFEGIRNLRAVSGREAAGLVG